MKWKISLEVTYSCTFHINLYFKGLFFLSVTEFIKHQKSSYTLYWWLYYYYFISHFTIGRLPVWTHTAPSLSPFRGTPSSWHTEVSCPVAKLKQRTLVLAYAHADLRASPLTLGRKGPKPPDRLAGDGLILTGHQAELQWLHICLRSRVQLLALQRLGVFPCQNSGDSAPATCSSVCYTLFTVCLREGTTTCCTSRDLSAQQTKLLDSQHHSGLFG